MSTPGSRERDLRVDFFRGLALVFIFIDHIPDNSWAYGTLRNFGFADASEVFVLLAGYSAGLAYGIGNPARDISASVRRATHRAAEIYVWHLGILVASAALLFTAAHVFEKPSYVDNIALREFVTDPLRSIVAALALVYQPNQMNILPLYVVLMLWMPVILMLMRRSVALTLAVSFAIWIMVHASGFNLPANRPGEGWFFNPLAWQLLFTTGAAASVVMQRLKTPPRIEFVIAALAYVLFAFVVAAPWVPITWLPNEPLFPSTIIGPITKHDLSVWRYLHIMALAYLVAALVPAKSAWLSQPWAAAINNCGKFSLEIFALGTILSFVGWIVIEQVGSTQLVVFVVNAVGIGLLSVTAWHMYRRKYERVSAHNRASSSVGA